MSGRKRVVVLMVGEKPSIANSIAHILGGSFVRSRKGRSPACPVHEFEGQFRGIPASFRVTSVTGHVYGTDFPPQFQNREQTNPMDLFDAPTMKVESNPKTYICKHLKHEAKGSDYLVLWLDCDREGENICFEVMENTQKYLNHLPPSQQQIFRAKFSAITASDLQRAMNNLVSPNRNEARAVDARQELDLKVGVAFSRFQTKYKYFQGKYGNLDANVISYGPCQTPTLGFCVDRYDEIHSFTPEPFWTLGVSVEKDGSLVKIDWDRGRLFDKEVCQYFEKNVKSVRGAIVTSVQEKEGKKSRPNGLNTVDMLKAASTQLGLGPHQTMQIAERLYIQGYLSYPRTESTSYPESFDLLGALKPFRNHDLWGDYVQSLLELGISNPKKGKDAGDHPPITPMRSAEEKDLGGDWRLYDFVARHFIASISPDCKYKKTKVKFGISGELFETSGKVILKDGFTLIMPWMRPKAAGLPSFQLGATLPVASVNLVEGKTSPPDYLTESELITLMEQHGIGTDASIPMHIQNICERNYVTVQGARRTLVPNPIGIALVHGYYRIDPEIVLPVVRSNVEKYINYIAQGQASYEEVVSHALEIFKKKFQFFVDKMSLMDELFEAVFSPIESTCLDSKLKTKCGICKRYMRFIPLKPCRLYCPTCEQTYSLPQGGKIKLYQEFTCPLDDFELVLYTVGGGGKHYPVCPYCYNNPVLEGVPKGTPCIKCPHPTCKHSLVKNGIMEHGEEGCKGMMVFDPNSGPKWKVDCNECAYAIFLPAGAHKITPTKQICADCGAVKLSVDFSKNNTPLPNGETLHVGCIQCDEILYPLISDGRVKQKRTVFRGRGGRRGGRGRGRGRR